MNTQTPAFEPSLPAGTDVPLDECFPIDDAPARSPNCISWGPHNVLQVCTRWSISFYLSCLLSPAHCRQIRHHPLCHRTDVESIEVVVGAKWSASLLPEVFYPASARLCVQTTSNLVVYRVTRHGTTRVEVSCGIGIACCRWGSRNSLNSNQPRVSASGSPSERAKPRSTAGAESSGDESEIPTSAVPRRRKAAAKATTTAKVKRAPTAAASAQKRRRHRSSSSSSSSSGSSGGSSSSDSDDTASTAHAAALKRRDREVTAIAATSALTVSDSGREGESTVPGATCGPTRKRANTSTQRHSSTSTMVHGDSDSLNYSHVNVLDYVWLTNDDLVVLSTRGLHVVPFYGDLSDDESSQIRDLPPPVYTWGGLEDAAALGFSGPTPVCFAPISANGLATQASASALSFLQRTVVLASPYLLRVVHIPTNTQKSSLPAAAQLICYMEVAALVSVPTAICAVAVALRSSAVSAYEVDTADIVAFLSEPNLVLRGRFTLALSSSTSSASALPLRSSTWATDAQYGPDQFVGEISLRGFLVAPFAAEVPTMRTDSAHGSSAAAVGAASTTVATYSEFSSGTLCTAVVGVGERSLFQYLLSGPSCVTLFQCPLLAGHSTMPGRKCAGVSGVALHPAGCVAVVAVQSGHANHEPVHLWPVTVDNFGSWLHRFVEFSGVLHDQEGGISDDVKRDAPSSGSPVANEAASANGNSSRSLCITKSLLRSQIGDAFFLWERLLGGSTAQSSALYHYAHVLQEMRQVPSHETLQQCWALGSARDAAAQLPSPLIADLSLRLAYLQLRSQHGVALFLRWPLPVSASGSGGQEGCIVSGFASAADIELKMTSWPWWRILRHIWASCPWDKPVLHELILSNAIRILSKRYGYANMAFSASERFRERAQPELSEKAGTREGGVMADASKCSTDPDTVDVDGARCYVEAYVRQQEKALELAAVSGGGGTALSSSAIVLTAASCEPPAHRSQRERSTRKSSNVSNRTQVHWSVSQAWVSTLKDFLVSVADGRNSAAPPASSSSLKASPSPAAAVREQIRFPCSLCDRDDVAVFHMDLSSTSLHAQPSVEGGGDEKTASPSSAAAAHTTIFSGTTFSSLSLFSPSYVLARCFSCGLSDYADGPLCRVCGGLLE
ncbi:hypothetical protein ABL78_6113 [Leptomonas seymouri]|uniref:Uncharacterized protein n=1 Tax=Leptomonas seymouri TaxID=5684 RepID=A0A0N0P433_LEPSE|nr:hypothetical protein ABL78_6113 [Leptomonas seymouri]|eukprot:KPI84829.1 hypothetical protein ABL78_6113 [Leptomonas seymouri]